ncbi:glycosyltransferase [Rhodococcus fascians]|nr:glycosyltransferase [Rhodococcus fascians]MBY3999174.1 glycosyltransferase [Rhodococcus fascians]MBY4000250.1 glycosyltransferase [Rhodococcus fascians]MBY4005278.1 glycosyltransferase [Rhodococcus fascians]MBY4016928.1 glycosyltransferase [Rhodococcus fascians]
MLKTGSTLACLLDWFGPEERIPLRSRAVLVAHPSPDLYGSDLQLLESISAITSKTGRPVVVVLPKPGPLVGQLESRGASVRIIPFPTLRRSVMTAYGLPRFCAAFVKSLVDVSRVITDIDPSVIYVNTVTIPEWAIAARIRRVPSLCHVHEAISDFPKPVRIVLASQLLFSARVVVNSAASLQAIIDEAPSVSDRSEIIYNGVSGPNSKPIFNASWHVQHRPIRLVMVGRISPRKGTDVAIAALRLVRDKGYNARLTICGTVFDGYEWYEAQLQKLLKEEELSEFVSFRGYINPTWQVLNESDIVLVPSRLEPFGNTAVEAQLSGKPLIASQIQGLAEIVQHDQTGLHAIPGDEHDLARQIIKLIQNPVLADELAAAGWDSATCRFGVERYQVAIAGVIGNLATQHTSKQLYKKKYLPMKIAMRKLKYILRLPEVKRKTIRYGTNWVSAVPGVPQSIRLRFARAVGIRIGQSRIGSLVHFSNENLVVGDRCEIGRRVRFEGIGRISIGNDVSIGRGAVLTTRRQVGTSTSHPPADSLLRIHDGSIVAPGILVSPDNVDAALNSKGRATC